MDAIGIAVPSTAAKGQILVDAVGMRVPEVGDVIVDDFARRDYALAWSERMVSLSAGDLDGDGDPDLVLSSDHAGAAPVVILRNDTTDSGVVFRQLVSGTLDSLSTPVGQVGRSNFFLHISIPPTGSRSVPKTRTLEA